MKPMKVVAVDKKYWPHGGHAHWCPGCKSGHEINTDQPTSRGAKWSFNGNMEKPTFTPSVNIQWGRFADPTYKPEPGETDHSGVCHYFITNGNIQYLGDSTHHLAGQTVPLPFIPDDKYLSSRILAEANEKK